MGKLKWVLKNKKLQYLKTRIFDKCILPILTYACQMWTLTIVKPHKIVKAQRAMEQSILGVGLKNKEQYNWTRKNSNGEIPQYNNGDHRLKREQGDDPR